ncbi:lysozyme inhibitor LprI family protein [Candidatus Colwellia aromaticivorans]|uniref:lysozyme inhibitor LprI family protein n=1 Tax=Candidatus Colwellia aromaticivorans TaxID=2267621 RepID=UPI000DF42E43|nr:lysozyme inhibitor LprI family protein [Candidatus Colwellia aromaticivorans]
MIKKLLTLNVLIVSQLLLSTPSYAQKTVDECEKAEQTTEKLSRCLDGVKDVVDRELQTWVNNHIFNLEEKALITGRYSTLKMFKRSQSNFITFRDNDCRWQYLVISPDKGAGNAYKKCYILLSQSRIKELSLVQ